MSNFVKFFLSPRHNLYFLRVPDLYMLSHEDYYNMKYILKDKKILLNIYQVHEFIDSLPSMNIEKRLLIYHAEWCIIVIDERRCNNEQSERD